ncbi:MAG: copper chaperone PCu(A)C [Sandarakinorhabdus sp.]|nr:copper chaperone PCu(A)C [Sandarakinorhabdus sp.]
MLRAIALSLLIATPALAATPPVKEAWDRTKPHASDAWIRAAAVPGRPAAGYLTITGGGQPDKMVAVTSPGLRVELHSMSMAGGVMKMAKLDSLPVPAGAKVLLATGGNHLMIFGMAGAPKTIPLTLSFGSGARVTTTAEVRAPSAMAPAMAPMPDPHAGHAQH